MSDLTTNSNDPRLGHGTDDKPVPQQKVYLILSKEEREKGFVRPYRDRYIHVGARGPKYPLRDLTNEEQKWGSDYVKYEIYPESESPRRGKFWTQTELDNVGKGCGAETIMGRDLSETYSRDPAFYGATYCVGCQMHKVVSEFKWSVDGKLVGS